MHSSQSRRNFLLNCSHCSVPVTRWIGVVTQGLTIGPDSFICMWRPNRCWMSSLSSLFSQGVGIVIATLPLRFSLTANIPDAIPKPWRSPGGGWPGGIILSEDGLPEGSYLLVGKTSASTGAADCGPWSGVLGKEACLISSVRHGSKLD